MSGLRSRMDREEDSPVPRLIEKPPWMEEGEEAVSEANDGGA